MTVQRSGDAILPGAPAAVAQHIIAELKTNPIYRNTVELRPLAEFRTTVKPSPWLMGTKMAVRLTSEGTSTRVRVQTTSQWFVLGDVGGFYEAYVRAFLQAVLSRAGNGLLAATQDFGPAPLDLRRACVRTGLYILFVCAMLLLVYWGTFRFFQR